MPRRALIHYIRDQLRQGYSPGDLRAVLRRSGYPDPDVQAAFRAVRWEPRIIFGLIIVTLAALVAVSILFFFRAERELVQPPAASLLLQASQIRPGERLPFELFPSNLASLVPAELRYAVVRDDEELLSGLDSVVLPSQGPVRGALVIPHSLAPGAYELHAKLATSGQQVTATASFTVVARQGNVHIVERPEQPSPVSRETSPRQPLQDIVLLAQEAPERAQRLCLELEQQLSDRCLLESGLRTSQAQFCAPIVSSDRRATCYFNLALASRDAALCVHLTDPYLRGTCAKI